MESAVTFVRAAALLVASDWSVAGKLEASDLTDGKMLKTVEGEELTVKRSGDKVMIVDAKGDSSMVTISNVNQSNGVIHVIDSVVMPN